jgi:catechol 2,3-dioxygenase-like lactoylglutathione lyase family enzyme
MWRAESALNKTVQARKSGMAQEKQSRLGKLFVCLNVEDLQTSVDFYQKVGFGMTGGDLADKWAILSDGENELHVFEGHVISNTLNFRGGDVFAIAAALKEQGLAMTSDAVTEDDGSDGAWIRDPDGNEIYFNTAPEERRTDG